MSAGKDAEVIFTFENTHSAMAAERQLIGADLQVRVMPLPANIGAGCGICLRVWPGEQAVAAAGLQAAGIQTQGVWRRISEAGNTRYVPDENGQCEAPTRNP